MMIVQTPLGVDSGADDDFSVESLAFLTSNSNSKMMLNVVKQTIIVLSLCAVAWCATNRGQSSKQQSLNNFCDLVLDHLRDTLRNKSAEVIGFPSVAPFGSGFFSGLPSIRRVGDASVRGSNRIIEMHAVLANDAHLSYPCQNSFFRRNVCIRGIKIYFQKVTFYLAFRVPPRTDPGGLPQLDVCDVTDVGRVLLRQDRGLFGPVMSWMGSWIVVLIKSRITRHLEDTLCNVVASYL